jgi:hypothetical protein
LGAGCADRQVSTVIIIFALLSFGAALFFFLFLVKIAKEASPVWLGGAQNPTLDASFRRKTRAGFFVEYSIRWRVERESLLIFIVSGMHKPAVQQQFVSTFNAVVMDPIFSETPLSFRITWNPDALIGSAAEFPVTLDAFVEKEGEIQNHNVGVGKAKSILSEKAMETGGCRFIVQEFELKPLSHELIEENYAMLSDEQKKEIKEDNHYRAYEEGLAVALLKRRLDLLQTGAHKYEANGFTIETEKAGRSLRIKWRFNANGAGHYLWGFRNTGGFSNDQWNETGNGTRVVDSYRDGEVVEVLQEGTTYFYNFFLKAFQDVEGQPGKKSPLRFQSTIETKAETEEITQLLSRFAERNEPEPEKETLSRAMKELGSYVEMDTAFEAMEHSFIEQIEKLNHPEETKKLKIERLQDIVRTIRSKYEP